MRWARFCNAPTTQLVMDDCSCCWQLSQAGLLRHQPLDHPTDHRVFADRPGPWQGRSLAARRHAHPVWMNAAAAAAGTSCKTPRPTHEFSPDRMASRVALRGRKPIPVLDGWLDHYLGCDICFLDVCTVPSMNHAALRCKHCCQAAGMLPSQEITAEHWRTCRAHAPPRRARRHVAANARALMTSRCHLSSADHSGYPS